MLSKNKIKTRSRKKTNPEIVSTIKVASKNVNWMPIAKILSGPTRLLISLNLNQIDKNSSIGDTLIVPGKVLSQGDLTKKIKICALSISKQAQEKLKNTKSEFIKIIDEIKKNSKAEGIKILK